MQLRETKQVSEADHFLGMLQARHMLREWQWLASSLRWMQHIVLSAQREAWRTKCLDALDVW